MILTIIKGQYMANILIADLREQSAYFLKAYYKGAEHKPIIAVNAEKANAFIETGVFDMLVADITVPDTNILKVVKHAHSLIPVMPIIAVVSKEGVSKDIESKIFCKIERPLKTLRIEQTLRDALNFIEMTCVNKRLDKRAEVSIPVLMKIENTPVPAQGRDLSTNGIAIEVPINLTISEGQTISAAIQLPYDSLEVTGAVSFIRLVNGRKTIGLRFVTKKTVRFKHINGYLSKAS